MKRDIVVLMIAGTLLGGCKMKEQYPVLIANRDTAVVPTVAGKVGGYYEDGVFIFKGLPYATAERFMPPVPTVEPGFPALAFNSSSIFSTIGINVASGFVLGSAVYIPSISERMIYMSAFIARAT